MFTSPTGVRLLMRYGEEVPRRRDLSTLRRVVCAGEVLNAPAWEWLQQTVLDDRVPVIDHMWQTETGGPIFGNPYGLGLAADQAGIGWAAVARDRRRGRAARTGSAAPMGEKGVMVIRRPFPGLIATLWGEPERYGADYW